MVRSLVGTSIQLGLLLQAGVVIAHDGAIVHPGVASLLQRVEGGAGVDGPSH